MAESPLLVKWGKLRLVIDVQPQHLMFSGHFDRLHDKAAADPLPAMIRMDSSVEDECVSVAVPGEVNEAHQLIPVISADVA